MMTLEEATAAIGRLGNEDTPEAALDALSLLELVTTFLPERGGRMAAAAVQLARDAVIAGKGPEDLVQLRASIRGSWQADLDKRFPNG